MSSLSASAILRSSSNLFVFICAQAIFCKKNFINSNDSKDDIISHILNENRYKCNVAETGRLINRIGIGKYNSKCNIDKCKKGRFDFINYVNENK